MKMSTPLRHIYTWRKVRMILLVVLVLIVMMAMLSPPTYSSMLRNIRGKKEPHNESSIPNKISQIFSVPADFEGPEPYALDPQVSPYGQKPGPLLLGVEID